MQIEHYARGAICIAFHPGGIADTGMGEDAPENLRQFLIDSGNTSPIGSWFFCH